MKSLFSPFTSQEVESIRSVVMLGQQSNEMLLTNCASRPVQEIRVFIRKFKKNILDLNVSPQEIATLANQQYLSIITAAREKRGVHVLPSAQSVMNLASVFTPSSETLPLKFRSKYNKSENDSEVIPAKSTIPTRSRSVQSGLSASGNDSLLKTNKRSVIMIIPPFECKLNNPCRAVSDIEAGGIALVARSPNTAPDLARVHAVKSIGGTMYALASFFFPDIPPCYVRINQVSMIKTKPNNQNSNNTFNVNAIIQQLISDAKMNIKQNDILDDSDPKNINAQCILIQTCKCAALMHMLSFLSNWDVPANKRELLIKSLMSLDEPKYHSSMEISQRCVNLIRKIISTQ